jgi:chromosomal replication initiation ATPase DnaA
MNQHTRPTVPLAPLAPTVEEWKAQLEREKARKEFEALKAAALARREAEEQAKAEASRKRAELLAQRRAKDRERQRLKYERQRAALLAAGKTQRPYRRKESINKPRPTAEHKRQARAIADRVALQYGVDPELIFSSDRRSRLVAARHCALYEISTRVPNMYLTALHQFTGLHHTSISHGIETHIRRLAGEDIQMGRPVGRKLIPYAGSEADTHL